MTSLCPFGLIVLQAGTAGTATWFDPHTLFTAAGSTAAVIAVTTFLQRFSSKLPAKWFALALAEVLAVMAVGVLKQGWNAVNIFIAVLNGLMTYAAAVGVNTAATEAPQPAPSATATGAPLPGPATKAVGGRSYRWWP
jgi:hypothetical protein